MKLYVTQQRVRLPKGKYGNTCNACHLWILIEQWLRKLHWWCHNWLLAQKLFNIYWIRKFACTFLFCHSFYSSLLYWIKSARTLYIVWIFNFFLSLQKLELGTGCRPENQQTRGFWHIFKTFWYDLSFLLHVLIIICTIIS